MNPNDYVKRIPLKPGDEIPDDLLEDKVPK